VEGRRGLCSTIKRGGAEQRRAAARYRRDGDAPAEGSHEPVLPRGAAQWPGAHANRRKGGSERNAGVCTRHLAQNCCVRRIRKRRTHPSCEDNHSISVLVVDCIHRVTAELPREPSSRQGRATSRRSCPGAQVYFYPLLGWQRGLSRCAWTARRTEHSRRCTTALGRRGVGPTPRQPTNGYGA
jgi:hypothetical protein